MSTLSQNNTFAVDIVTSFYWTVICIPIGTYVYVFWFILLSSRSHSLAIVDGREVQQEFFFHDVTAPSGPGPPLSRGFTATLKHTTLSKTPLDEWSARRSGLFPTTHNNQKRQTFMLPAGFEPAISTSERPLGSANNKLHSFGKFYVT